jgi:hypothetical protein
MLLRVLIGLGALLMLVGFGAAGVEYWQNRPVAEGAGTATEAVETSEVPVQSWLISPTGGLVPQAEVRAYLTQDRFVESRTASITQTALLSELLLDGEKLPEAAYLQVLADIRAPRVAGNVCEVLLQSIAAECAINRARVVDGSVDAVAGKARFGMELVYRLKPPDEELPDLAKHVLMTETVSVDFEAGAEGARVPDELLSSAVNAAVAACDAAKKAVACRIVGLDTTWFDNGSGAVLARIAWLAPFPKGLIPVPPLGAPGG